jgi:hypothetical protein
MDEWVWSIGEMILNGERELVWGKCYTASVVDGWKSMEYWQNDTARGNRNSERGTLETSVVDAWMSVVHWWNNIDWVKRIRGRETLYHVGGKWINKYRVLVEWHRLGIKN